MSEIDPKVVERIQKLLRLANDGGATEGEASNAMAMADRLMAEHNLTMAALEMSGQQGAEQRLKKEEKGRANYRWQRWLMKAIADANYCVVLANVEQRRMGTGMRDYTTGYQLIGRVSNVTATRHMYDYLLKTCARLRKEYEMEPGNGAKEGSLFVEGLANRLAERVREHHEELLRTQRAEAEKKKREEAARTSHPSAAPTGNALVVVLADFAQTEADLNNDIRQGWEPGTTAAKRAEAEAKARAEKERYQSLIDAGVESDVAWYMAYMNWEQERAERYVAAQKAAEEKSGGRSRSRGGWGRSREDRLNERLYSGAAGDGRRVADKVSLNPQMASSESRRLK